MAPILLSQRAALGPAAWSTGTVTANSAAPVDLFQLDHGLAGRRFLPWTADTSGTGQRLWPGLLVVVGGTIGLLVLRRLGGHRRHQARLLAVIALVAAVASLGLRLDLAGFQTYALIRRWVPGWSQLRSPFRIVVLIPVALTPAVAVAIDAVVRFLRPGTASRRDRHRRPAVVRAGVASLAVVLAVFGTARDLAARPTAHHGAGHDIAALGSVPGGASRRTSGHHDSWRGHVRQRGLVPGHGRGHAGVTR